MKPGDFDELLNDPDLFQAWLAEQPKLDDMLDGQTPFDAIGSLAPLDEMLNLSKKRR